MDITSIQTVVLWTNTAGLVLGFFGALLLTLLPKSFIKINPDGTETWGNNDLPNEVYLRRNIRLRRAQKYGMPIAYTSVAVGFLFQLIALLIPVLSGGAT